MPPLRRRKKVPGGRPIVYHVTLTEQEDQILQERANAAGVTVVRLLSECTLGSEDDISTRKMWWTQLATLRQQMKESGYSQELQDKASDLLRRLEA